MNLNRDTLLWVLEFLDKQEKEIENDFDKDSKDLIIMKLRCAIQDILLRMNYGKQ